MSTPREKVAKLLAMAHDGRGNAFEAEAALRQAEKLMRKHGIDAAELQDRTGTAPVYKWATVLVPAGAPQPIKASPLWFGMLISSIGRFTDCKVAYEANQQYGICAKFSGEEVDVQFAVWLCKRLRDDCRIQASAYDGTKSERESFRKAYASRVGERMTAMLAERKAALEAVVTTTGTALVVVNAKLALRDEQFGKQTYGRSSSYRTEYMSARAGRAAGDRAGLSRPLGQDAKRLA